MSDWLPIETAPKDGSRVLLYGRVTGDPERKLEAVLGRYDPDLAGEWVGQEYEEHTGWCSVETTEEHVGPEWYNVPIPFSPTHWMPIKPPSA